jgi:hypothetical protein
MVGFREAMLDAVFPAAHSNPERIAFRNPMSNIWVM